jgi:hypothetical protein
VICRTSVKPLPSGRLDSSRIIFRSAVRSISEIVPFIAGSPSGNFSFKASRASVLILSISSCLEVLSGVLTALVIRAWNWLVTAATISGSGGSDANAIVGRPHLAASAFCISVIAGRTLIAASIAPRKTSSPTSFIPPSSITTWSPTATTTRSTSDSVLSLKVGLTMYSSPFLPILTAPRGPPKGAPARASAADAPIKASTSESFCWSEESTVATICTSLVKPSGKSDLIGLSIRRALRISFSVIRPSRLKNPPGILPAA